MTRLGAPGAGLSVVLMARSLNYGGAERQLVELAKGLCQRGHVVNVTVFYAGGPLLADLGQSGVPVTVLAKRSRWDVARFLWRFGRHLRRLRPHVLYAFLVEPSLLAVLAKFLLPGTRVVWGVRASNVDFSTYGWFPRITYRASRALARFADLIIANSWAGAIHHRADGYPPTRMTVIPNGIDLDRFRPDPDAGRRSRRTWKIPEQSRVIGLVGRLDPMKDHATFLEAAARLRRAQPDTFFVCVGDGAPAYRAELGARAAALGLADRVIWTGHEDDMTAVYNGFDVCCLPSAFGEGFPNVLGEALACGVPCVTTDVGDAARIVGECGRVVPVRDPERLAEALEQTLARGPDLKGYCRARVEREFSVARMVAETERALRACVYAAA